LKKFIVALVLGVLLSVAIALPALADEGGQYNVNAEWGQMHKIAIQDEGPGAIGDKMSFGHEGKKDLPWPPWEPGDGGIRGWILSNP
jgi:hypothetical protein